MIGTLETGFPAEPLDIKVEMFLRGRWVPMGPYAYTHDDPYTDVYLDVYGGRIGWNLNRLEQQDITITHGRADERSDCSPASVSLRLANRDGQLTPDDPRSRWWPDVAKGAPFRIGVRTVWLFWGEVSSIDPVWPLGDLSMVPDEDLLDLAAADPQVLGECWVDVTASGILRRLNEGQKPLRSPLQRCATAGANLGHLSGYWPMEDGAGADRFSSGFPAVAGTILPSIEFSAMTLAADAGLPGSDPLPTVRSGTTGGWAGAVPGPAGHWVEEFVLHLPQVPTAESQGAALTVYTTGTHSTWSVTTGLFPDLDVPFIRLTSYGPDGTALIDQLQLNPVHLFGGWVTMRLEAIDTPDGVDGSLQWSPITPDIDAVERLDQVVAGDAGAPYFSRFTASNSPGDVGFGHLMMHDGIPAGWLVGPDVGWQGEPAGERITRLCGEENVPLSTFGDLSATALMGAQRSATLMELLTEAKNADGGILCERRTALGLVYRTLRWRYNRPADLVLDAALSQIAGLAPTNDDQTIRNDITMQRINGGKVQVIDAASAADAPRGDGHYDDQLQRSLFKDTQTRHHAGWELHLGTNGSKTRDLPSGQKLRYPTVVSDLGIAGRDRSVLWGGAPIVWGGIDATWGDVPSLIDLWTSARVGYRLQVINPPPQHPIEGPIDQIIEGWSETLAPFSWVATPNCSPAGPFDVALWGISRWSPQTRVLAESIDATQTTFAVTATPIPWTTTDLPFQIRLGGVELCTVTAVAAPSGGSQVFTVVRDENEFGRPHSSGDPVRVFPQAVLAL